MTGAAIMALAGHGSLLKYDAFNEKSGRDI